MSASNSAEPSLDREVVGQILRSVRRVLLVPLALAALLAGWLLYLAISMVLIGNHHSSRNADVAIVLGAGVTAGRPSAPFDVRIRYGVQLYKAGRVKRLLFTGGSILGQREEAYVARDQAIAMGVPAKAILVDPVSWTTQLNFVEAKKVMAANDAKTALVVTEPLHMMRSMAYARDLGMQVTAEPLPQTFYQDWRSWFAFVRSELFFYHIYLIYGR